MLAEEMELHDDLGYDDDMLLTSLSWTAMQDLEIADLIMNAMLLLHLEDTPSNQNGAEAVAFDNLWTLLMWMSLDLELPSDSDSEADLIMNSKVLWPCQ